jgi:hypothetical protein
VNLYCKYTRAMTLRIFGRMWQNGARSSPRRRRKSRRWGRSLSHTHALIHSLTHTHGARSSTRRRRKSRRWGLSLSLSLSLALSLSRSRSRSRSLSCLLTSLVYLSYTQAKSVAASSSWTIVRIWFGITNKLRITGASTKVLTAVTLYYCTLYR